jgi:hypothetical protein
MHGHRAPFLSRPYLPQYTPVSAAAARLPADQSPRKIKEFTKMICSPFGQELCAEVGDGVKG